MSETNGVPISGEKECTGTTPYSRVPKLVSINSPGSAKFSLLLERPMTI